MAKSDAHVGYVGRVRASDGKVLSGTFIAPILRSQQRLNTFRMKGWQREEFADAWEL